MAGIVLTGNLRPGPSVLKVIRAMPIPVLLTAQDSYQVASQSARSDRQDTPERRRKNLLDPRFDRQKRELAKILRQT